jgi:S1-C subfamily serine protease
MRAAILFSLGLLGACSHPAPKAPAPIEGPHSAEAARLTAETVAFVVQDLEETHAYCSGVWVSDTSLVTAAHCLEFREPGEILDYVTHDDVFAPGDLAKRPAIVASHAMVYAVDDAHDLALLRASSRVHEYVHTTLAEVRPGAFVATMGHPMGLWWSYSSGEVAAVRLEDIGGESVWIQATAPISPGNSGGGLFDERGYLIGIASRSLTRGQMLNFYVHGQYVDALMRKQASL